MAQTLFILTQNFRENNADFRFICRVFSILILIFSARKIGKTHIVLQQNSVENSANFE
jgi:hypothetical protein